MNCRTLDFKMVSEVIKKFARKGFLLDKDMLVFLESLDLLIVDKIIEKFLNLGVKEKIITKSLFDEKKEYFSEFISKEPDDFLKDDVKVLSCNLKKSKGVLVSDFLAHFVSRYNILKGILEKKEIENLASVRRVGNNNGVYNIIASVVSKKFTKNKNLLIEVEDLTGLIIVLVNRENKELFLKAKNLMLDDVVCFKTSGSNKMLFCNDIIFPDSKLEVEKFGESDEYVAFLGDLHVGSKMFLENNFLKFVNWINGEVGNERQREISRKVKYLFLVGDNIDGVGVYQDQKKYLNIKSSREQYIKFSNLLQKIRKDVSIIICPGQHDSVWVGERQDVISKKFAPGLCDMKNVCLVTNPAVVEIKGFKIMIYHGASINKFIDELPEIRIKFGNNKPLEIAKEMLKRRHLAPTHGVMDYIPEEKDFMTIENVPDIFVIGGQHKTEIDNYNKILLISVSCFKEKTPFEDKFGNDSDFCKVSLFNFKTREIKIMDFSDEKIKWEEDVKLFCKLDGKL